MEFRKLVFKKINEADIHLYKKWIQMGKRAPYTYALLDLYGGVDGT